MDKILDSTIKRVRYFIDYKGISIREFSRNINVSHSLISNAKTLGSDKLESILYNYPEINAFWLLTGKGKMLKQISNTYMVGEPQSTYTRKKPKSFNIIEINPEAKANTLIADVKASAGFGSLIDNPKKLEQLPAISLPNAPFGLNVAFQIEGDSMHPTIRHLDFVAANQLIDVKDLRDGYTYIIIDKDDGVLCKRLYREGMDFKIVSDNPNYPPYKRSQYDIIAFFKCFMRLSTDFRTYHNDVRNAIQDLLLKYESLERRISI